jgi:hypothetical protein
MIPDRSLLVLFVLTMLATLVRSPWPVCETLGLVCGLRTLRSHAKSLRSDYVSPSRMNNSSTARCASSIA